MSPSDRAPLRWGLVGPGGIAGRFAAALLPAIPRPADGFHADRIAWTAARLHEIRRRRKLTLLVCSILDWPWIREAFQQRAEPPDPEPVFAPTSTFGVAPETFLFLLGELPFVTALYERGRRELTPDDNLSVDGVKELVLQAREALRAERPKLAQRVTPSLLATLLRYARNLALIERRVTPDLFPLVPAALIATGVRLDVGGVVLMALGSAWYILFNVIAGASAIPHDLREAATNLRLSPMLRWRTLILPAIFASYVTGGITAAGGAWNASIVAEVVSFHGTTLTATGLGAYITTATADGDAGRILVGVVVMSMFVVTTNRVFWRRMYALAVRRYSLS